MNAMYAKHSANAARASPRRRGFAAGIAARCAAGRARREDWRLHARRARDESTTTIAATSAMR